MNTFSEVMSRARRIWSPVCDEAGAEEIVSQNEYVSDQMAVSRREKLTPPESEKFVGTLG